MKYVEVDDIMKNNFDVIYGTKLPDVRRTVLWASTDEVKISCAPIECKYRFDVRITRGGNVRWQTIFWFTNVNMNYGLKALQDRC